MWSVAADQSRQGVGCPLRWRSRFMAVIYFRCSVGASPGLELERCAYSVSLWKESICALVKRFFQSKYSYYRHFPLEHCTFGTLSECGAHLQARLHWVPVSRLIDPLDSSTYLDPNGHMFRPRVWSIHPTGNQLCALCCVFCQLGRTLHTRIAFFV